VLHNPIWIKIQLDATVWSLIYFTAKSLYMFRVSNAPIIRSTGNVARSGLVPTWPRWREVAVPILWPVPEATVTVFSTPDDWCGRHPKHVEWFCSKINQTAYCCLHTVASTWIFIHIDYLLKCWSINDLSSFLVSCRAVYGGKNKQPFDVRSLSNEPPAS